VPVVTKADTMSQRYALACLTCPVVPRPVALPYSALPEALCCSAFPPVQFCIHACQAPSRTALLSSHLHFCVEGSQLLTTASSPPLGETRGVSAALALPLDCPFSQGGRHVPQRGGHKAVQPYAAGCVCGMARLKSWGPALVC
jgi:hypothetical protein